MTKILESAAVRLRAASLVLTMLTLIGGILALHILAGGHGTGDHGSSSDHHSAAVLPAEGASPALAQPAASNHQTHHGVEPASSNALMTVDLTGHETGHALAQSTLPSHTECHEACPEMVVLNCVLALTLLGLAVPPRRTFYLRLPVPRISMDALLLLQKSITPTGLSPAQLSISRT